MGWSEALQALGTGLTNLPRQLDQLEQLKLNKQLAPLQLAQAQQQLAAAQQQQALAARSAQVGEAKIATEGIGFDRPVSADSATWQSIQGTPYTAPFEATGGAMPGQSMQMDAAGGIAPGDPAVGNALGLGTLTQGPAQMLKRPSFNEVQLIKQEENARRAAEAQQKIAQGLRRLDQGDVRNDQGQQRIDISAANADSLALYRDALKAGLEAGRGLQGEAIVQTFDGRDEQGRPVKIGRTRTGEMKVLETPEGVSIRQPGTNPAAMIEMSSAADLAAKVLQLGDSLGWSGVGGLGQGSIAQGLAKHFGYGKEEEILLRSEIGNVQATIAKMRAGATLTPMERELLMTYMPDINENPKVIRTKIRGFLEFVNHRKELFNTSGMGSPADADAPPTSNVPQTPQSQTGLFRNKRTGQMERFPIGPDGRPIR